MADPLLERMRELDLAFAQVMPTDERFKSGLPDAWRVDEQTFVQLAGITRRREPAPASTEDPEHLDSPGAPSFRERGVSDVDSDIGPRGIEAENDELLPMTATSPPSKSLSEFKSLIQDLERAAGVAAGEEDEGESVDGSAEEGQRIAPDYSRMQLSLAEAEQLLQALEKQERDLP